jgi:hypothetical protein
MAYIEQNQILNTKINVDINKILNNLIHKILDYDDNEIILSFIESIDLNNSIDFTNFNIKKFNSDIVYAIKRTKKFRSINKKKNTFDFIQKLNTNVLLYYNSKNNVITDTSSSLDKFFSLLENVLNVDINENIQYNIKYFLEITFNKQKYGDLYKLFHENNNDINILDFFGNNSVDRDLIISIFNIIKFIKNDTKNTYLQYFLGYDFENISSEIYSNEKYLLKYLSIINNGKYFNKNIILNPFLKKYINHIIRYIDIEKKNNYL